MERSGRQSRARKRQAGEGSVPGFFGTGDRGAGAAAASKQAHVVIVNTTLRIAGSRAPKWICFMLHACCSRKRHPAQAARHHAQKQHEP